VSLGRHTRALRRATNLVGTGDEAARRAHITSLDGTQEWLGEATNHPGSASERPGSRDERCWVVSPDHSGETTQGQS
jgi:hypothetical protein